MSDAPLRDNRWLQERVQNLWRAYYQDAPTGYPILAKFGPRARYRYGSIYSQDRQCVILVNRLFAHPGVPEYVLDATVVHELAHYVHGYGSGLRKLHSHPHRGGVVDRELEKRGCFFLEEKAAEWRRDHWQTFYASLASDAVARKAEREKRETTQWELYLSTPGFRTEAAVTERLRELAPKFGFDAAPFTVHWMLASLRRNGLSYRFRREETVRIHGILADTEVPDAVIDYELSYWLAVEAVGERWEDIERAMRAAGIWTPAQGAIKWRRTIWPKYCSANHPLKAK